MYLSKREQAMQRAQSEGNDSVANQKPMPPEYAADASMKAAWEVGRKNATNGAVADQKMTTQQAKMLLEKIETELASIVVCDHRLKLDTKEWAILIAEAMNLSAKLNKNNPTKRDHFYQMKEKAIHAACVLDCEAGLGQDEEGKEVLYLYAPKIGTASFHTEHLSIPLTTDRWRGKWSAVRRQRWSYGALGNAKIRALLADFTAPEAVDKTNVDFRKEALAEIPSYLHADFEG